MVNRAGNQAWVLQNSLSTAEAELALRQSERASAWPGQAQASGERLCRNSVHPSQGQKGRTLCSWRRDHICWSFQCEDQVSLCNMRTFCTARSQRGEDAATVPESNPFSRTSTGPQAAAGTRHASAEPLAREDQLSGPSFLLLFL